MNKYFCLALLTFFSGAALASHDADEKRLNGYELGFAGPDSRRIVRMDSPIFRTTGSAAEIVERARDCIARNVSDKQGSGTTLAGVLGSTGEHSSTSDGSQIEGDDPGKGLLEAHSRAQFRHLLLLYEARSRFALDAHDGSFKIIQTDLGYRQLDTGNSAYQDFAPIQRLALTGWDDALEGLQEVSNTVSTCIGTNNPVSD